MYIDASVGIIAGGIAPKFSKVVGNYFTQERIDRKYQGKFSPVGVASASILLRRIVPFQS